MGVWLRGGNEGVVVGSVDVVSGLQQFRQFHLSSESVAKNLRDPRLREGGS